MTSDAMFKMCEGEFERLTKHLRDPRIGMTDEQIKLIKRSYTRGKCMFACPEPKIIVQHLYDVYSLFAEMEDPEREGGQLVLVSNAHALMIKEMKYVQLGLLSDLPGMTMYREVRKLATGFIVHRSRRNSSALEAQHYHYRLSQHPSAKTSGPVAVSARSPVTCRSGS
jgi:hypothetical protein